MEWFNYTQYKDHNYLEQLRDTVIDEYNNSKQSLDFQNTGLPVGDLYNTNDMPNVNWFGYPILTAEVFEERFVKYWPKTTALVKTIPGVINCCINFVGPNSVIPPHVDTAISTEIIGNKEAIGVIIGISMPSSDPKIVGFEVGGVTKGWDSGEIVAINGYLSHSGWNHSNSWRVSLIIDLDKTYWDIK